MGALNELYRKYRDRVTFYLVYIREAHPAGSRRPDREVRVQDPTTILERAEVATRCTASLDIELPVLIDDLKNTAEQAYAAWPDRLFLIDTQRKVAWRSGPGPRGFDPAGLADAITKLLERAPAADDEARQELLEQLKERRRREVEGE